MRKEIFPDLPDDVIILGNFNQLYKVSVTREKLLTALADVFYRSSLQRSALGFEFWPTCLRPSSGCFGFRTLARLISSRRLSPGQGRRSPPALSSPTLLQSTSIYPALVSATSSSIRPSAMRTPRPQTSSGAAPPCSPYHAIPTRCALAWQHRFSRAPFPTTPLDSKRQKSSSPRTKRSMSASPSIWEAA